MFTANDIVRIGDKIDVHGECFPEGRVHILAQVRAGQFTLINIKDGNRICDPFSCKYGLRLGSGNISEDEISMYGSFSLQDLHDAVASQSTSSDHIGERIADHYTYKIIERYCNAHVFEDLARLWNEKEPS
jgi:hypothetical protein